MCFHFHAYRTPITNYVLYKRSRGGDWERCGQPTGTSYRVRNLEQGVAYEFAVCASNAQGDGEKLETDTAIVAKPPFDVPDAPGAPEPIHTSDEAITVGWTKPRDGGSPITGYGMPRAFCFYPHPQLQCSNAVSPTAAHGNE